MAFGQIGQLYIGALTCSYRTKNTSRTAACPRPVAKVVVGYGAPTLGGDIADVDRAGLGQRPKNGLALVVVLGLQPQRTRCPLADVEGVGDCFVASAFACEG